MNDNNTGRLGRLKPPATQLPGMPGPPCRLPSARRTASLPGSCPVSRPNWRSPAWLRGCLPARPKLFGVCKSSALEN